jgi:hypothetical protein
MRSDAEIRYYEPSGNGTNQALGQFPLKKKTPTVTRTSAPPWDRREVRGAPENTLRLVRHR